MASAQILQLYYTKDNKSQQGNQSKYHQQRSKPFLHGWQSITIPRKQFQTHSNTFSKLTDYFYSFQSTRTNNSNISANTNNNKGKSKSNNTIAETRYQLQHHKSLLVSTENNIEESGVPKKTTSQQSTSSIIIVDEEDHNKDDEAIEGEDISTRKYQRISTEQQIWWKDIFNFPKDENFTSEDDTTIDAIVADTFDDCEISLLADPEGVHLYHGWHSIAMSARSSDVAKPAKRTLQQHNQLGYSGKANNRFQPKMCSPLPSKSQSQSKSSPWPSSSSSTSNSLLSPSLHSNFHSNDKIGEDAGYEFAAKQVASIPQQTDPHFTGNFKQGKKGNGSQTVKDEAHQISTTMDSRDIFNGDSATACVNFVAIKGIEGQVENEEWMGEKNNYATPTPKPKSTSTTTKTTTTGTTTATTTTKKTKNCATCCQNNAPSNTSVVVAGVDKTCFLQKRIDFYRKDSPDEANGYCLLCKFKPNTCQKSKSQGCCENCCQHYVKSELPILSSEETLGNNYEYEYDQGNWNFTNQTKRQQSSNHITSTSDCSSSLLLQSTTSGSTTSTTKTTTTTRTTLSRLSSKQPCCCNETKRGYESDSKQFQQIHHQQHQQQHLRQQRTAQLYNFDCQKCDNRKSPICITNIVATNNSDKSKSISNITNHNVNCNDIDKPRLFSTSKPYDTNNNSHNNSNSKKFCRKLSENALHTFADVQRFTRAILPLIIIFNILPLLYAVASNYDATKLKDGPNVDPNLWMPVVEYVEPLPRPVKLPKCDQTFVSRVGGPQNGTFSAPLIHNPKNHSRQCLYIFLAGPGQRVEVVFTTFNLRGSPPDGSAVGELPTCVHEYMDIYSEVQSSDPADLINSPFGGRFCGTIPPRRRISMHRAIAISFFTNKNVTEPDLFEGHYRFLSASEYEIGIPIAGSPCSYTITPSMSINKTGALISPTYPGAYPKDMSCTYQFLGETNQRVRLEFRDFDLFFGGPHCPFDYVKVYDGPDNSSALIGTYCGQQRNLVLYSSESSLFVHFYTLPRTANTQNRGFKGIYEFSESFVKLDFIRENDGIHIRGSECDQKILSKKESTGFVLSPNYPYPYIPKTVCRYFIYGMQDAQHLERVRLEFSAFNIPKVEHKDKSESNCTDGYLKIYLKGQETADAYDKFDYELCGNETQRVVSDGPRLAMVFSSGELQGRGFKGKYIFETEYKIPGTAAPDGTCSFTYMSNSKKRGELNSPRYPSNYPSETNCTYLFLAEPNEQVTIVFDHFKVKADNANSTAGAYGASACFEDWLEMYVIYRDNNDRFLGRYCGLTAPGPVESPRGAVGLRITLHTDQENVASGFKARYYFETTKSDVGDCGGNFSNEDSGIITSPHYPSNYKSPAKGMASMACNWYMTARPGYKLSINFEHFSVEGDPMARGCPAAVLRMWTNVDSEAPPIELCGEKPPTEHWHYITTGQSARISFTTTDKTIGAQGFRIVWTEIQDSGPGPPAIGLLCESTYHFQCNVGYCISDKLRCDGIKNCGPGDDSDEMHCIMEAPKEDHGVLIIISMAVVSFLICLLCTLCHRQKKRRHRQLGLHRNTGHYDSTTSATVFNNSCLDLSFCVNSFVLLPSY